MSGWLLDTNVVSELRKRERANRRVAAWYEGISASDVFLSVLVVGELRKGIESIRRRDPRAAMALDRWLSAIVSRHRGRILAVDADVADAWGRLDAAEPVPVIDGLLAATALTHGLTLATRNVKDIRRTGVTYVDPFTGETNVE